MLEPLEESKPKLTHGEDLPIDDMLDGRDIHQWPEQFGQVISYIHTTLYEDYLIHDMKAVRQQKMHRWTSFIAIVSGTIAILLSLTAIFLEAKEIPFPKEYFYFLKLAAFLITIVVVIVASMVTRPHENWLIERFCAEEYRSRKFRALLQNSLFCNKEKPWNERYSLWKTWLDGQNRTTKNGIKKSVQSCIEGETVFPSPQGNYGCSFDEGYLKDLGGYYLGKRLETQIHYFDKRSDELERQDKRFRVILKWFFTLGIVFVLFQLIIDNSFLKSNDVFQALNIIIVLIILTLPIFGFAIKTVRSSSEVARSASLYRAKRNSLVDFRNHLIIELERVPRNWEEIVKILWECENYLEEVNREWLRMMKESEWHI